MTEYRAPAPPRQVSVALRVVALAAAIAGLASIATPAMAERVPCDEIDLRFAMNATEEPRCWSGYGGDANFRLEWESIEMTSGDRIAMLEVQRAMRRGSFYRPTLEDVVELLYWDDVVDSEWSTGIAHPDFTARQVELELDDGNSFPCFGFMHYGQGPNGGAKQVVYGLVCNLNGLAFSEGEAVEILSGVDF